MKRVIITLLNCLIFTFFITACSNDDVPVQEGDSNDPPQGFFLTTKGVFVVNSGSVYQSIDGSLTYLDYELAAPPERDIYKRVNGKSLGGTPNDVIVYGEKVYIVGSDENTIFVLMNARTCKELKQVSTTDLLGDDEGRNPRRIVGYGGKVYFTTHGGYVAAIDTINFALQQKYRVGSAPEGLAFGERETLYVANSDWGYGNGSISKIDITTGIATEIRNDKVMYPQEIAVIGDALYVLDWGYFGDELQQFDAGVYRLRGNGAQMVVPNATGMAAAGDMIYTYNNPNGCTRASYSTFDIRSNNLSTLNLSGDANHKLISPSAISVDPLTGYIYIASRRFSSDTDYYFYYPEPSSDMPGFVNIYNSSGQFIDSFDAGVEPRKIAFYHELAKVVPDWL